MADTSKLSVSERIDEAFRNPEIVTKAISKAAKLAGRQHKLAGYSIAVERDGEVIVIPADDIPDD